MEWFFIILIIVIGYIISENNVDGFLNYPVGIIDCKDGDHYQNINNEILSSPRLNSYRSYYSNKDMYSLNSRILKDKNCEPNSIPTSFY